MESSKTHSFLFYLSICFIVATLARVGKLHVIPICIHLSNKVQYFTAFDPNPNMDIKITYKCFHVPIIFVCAFGTFLSRRMWERKIHFMESRARRISIFCKYCNRFRMCTVPGSTFSDRSKALPSQSTGTQYSTWYQY